MNQIKSFSADVCLAALSPPVPLATQSTNGQLRCRDCMSVSPFVIFDRTLLSETDTQRLSAYGQSLPRELMRLYDAYHLA